MAFPVSADIVGYILGAIVKGAKGMALGKQPRIR
jgi:hypothetical protein